MISGSQVSVLLIPSRRCTGESGRPRMLRTTAQRKSWLKPSAVRLGFSASLLFRNIHPFFPRERRADGRAGRQEGEEPGPRRGVERRAELGDLERVDEANIPSRVLAVG